MKEFKAVITSDIYMGEILDSFFHALKKLNGEREKIAVIHTVYS
jgi:hypothetical protein